MYKYFGYSNLGLLREINEDVFALDNTLFIETKISGTTINPLFAVFDGVGGVPGGDNAARVAANYLINHQLTTPNEQTIRLFLMAINEEVRNISEGATTVAGVLIAEENLYVFNIGDSRVSRYREGLLLQLSHDHSPNGSSYPYNNVITEYLGKINLLVEAINVFSYEIAFIVGDVLLICTDGVSNFITNEELTLLIEKNNDFAALSAAINELIIHRGAPDNYTYILIKKEESYER